MLPTSARGLLFLLPSTVTLALAADARGQTAARQPSLPQAPWVATFGGAGSTRVSAVERAAGGGYLVAGNTTLPNGPANGSMWVASIDGAGQARWETAFFGADGSAFGAMVADPDGGCVVVGRIHEGAGYAGWILRLTGQGAVAWQKSYRGGGGESFTAVAQSPRGYYVGGTVERSAFGQDACALEVDRAGVVLWQKRLAGDLDEQLWSIAATGDGVAVSIDSQSSLPGSPGVPFFRPWLVKLDRNGNALWQKTYNFSGGDTWKHVLALQGGGFLATGEAISMGYFRGDAWLVRLDNDGNVLWNQCYGDNNRITWADSAIRAVEMPGGGFAVLGSTATAGVGSEDLWLLRVDAQGALQWSRTYGREGFDGGHSLARFEDGDLLLVGFAQFYGQGFLDGFALRVRADGTALDCAGGGLTRPIPTSLPLQIDAVSVIPSDLSLVEGTPVISVRSLDTAALACRR